MFQISVFLDNFPGPRNRMFGWPACHTCLQGRLVALLTQIVGEGIFQKMMTIRDAGDF